MNEFSLSSSNPRLPIGRESLRLSSTTCCHRNHFGAGKFLMHVFKPDGADVFECKISVLILPVASV